MIMSILTSASTTKIRVVGQIQTILTRTTDDEEDKDDVITCDADYLRSNRPKKIIKYYGKRRKYHLTRSFIANNYLTDEETIRLCKKSELTKEQLQTWFCHKRDELKSAKMLDNPG